MNEIVNSNKKQSYKIKNIINFLSFSQDQSHRYFSIIVTFLYASCVMIGMYYHELWRDELDIYARICYNSFQHFNGPQGFTTFCSLVYFGLLRLTLTILPSFAAYQAYHFIIIVTAVYIFNRYSNFNKLQKILFSFSYFLVFEYGIISRWYGFAVLLIFTLVYLLTREKKNYVLISLLLIILANHNPSTTIFSASLAIYAVIHIVNGFKAKIISSNEKKQIIIASIILGAGTLLVISENIYYFVKGGGNPFGMLGHPPPFMTLRTIWNSYVPVPDFSQGANFWNTNVFNFIIVYPKSYDMNYLMTFGNVFTVIMSLIFITICLFIFSSKPPVLLTYVINTGLYFVYIHYIFRAHFIRHLGLLFIIFVYCAWLYKHSNDYIRLPLLKFSMTIRGFSESKLVKTLFPLFVTLVFFFQFLAGVMTYSQSIKYQFTKSWDTARYIKTHNFDEYILVGAIDYCVQPIAAILHRDIYFPQTGQFSKIVIYSRERDLKIKMSKLFKDSIYLLNTHNKKVLIVLNFEYKNKDNIPVEKIFFPDNILFRKLLNFKGNVIQADEQYYLYELVKTL